MMSLLLGHKIMSGLTSASSTGAFSSGIRRLQLLIACILQKWNQVHARWRSWVFGTWSFVEVCDGRDMNEHLLVCSSCLALKQQVVPMLRIFEDPGKAKSTFMHQLGSASLMTVANAICAQDVHVEPCPCEIKHSFFLMAC